MSRKGRKSGKNFLCDFCGLGFINKRDLIRHGKKKHEGFECNFCLLKFYSKIDLKKHFKEVWCKYCSKHFKSKKFLRLHLKKCEKMVEELMREIHKSYITCDICKERYEVNYFYNHKKSLKHINALMKEIADGCELYEEGLEGKIKKFKFKIDSEACGLDLEKAFNCVENNIKNLLRREFSMLGSLRFRIIFVGIFHKYAEEKLDVIEGVKSFCSGFKILLDDSQVEEKFLECKYDINRQTSEFEKQTSGWSMEKVVDFYVDVIKYSPLSGGSYLALPENLKRKNALLNIIAVEQNCFLLCVAAKFFGHLVPKSFKNDENFYTPYLEKFNVQGIKFPVNYHDIERFEKKNFDKFNFSIFVYTYDLKTKKYGVFYTSKTRGDNFVDLLLLVGEKNAHFVLIKKLSRLLRSSLTKNKCEMELCRYCLKRFNSKEDFKNHEEIGCLKTKVIIPREPVLRFKKRWAQVKQDFVAYGDIESLCVPILGCQQNPNISYTENVQAHVPFLCAYKFVSFNDDSFLDNLRMFEGQNCVDSLVKKIYEDCQYIYFKYFFEIYKCSKIPLETLKIYLERNCFICGEPLERLTRKRGSDKKPRKERLHLDHHHSWPDDKNLPLDDEDDFPRELFRGNTRGVVHDVCNSKYCAKAMLCIIFHNLGAYDGHFILNSISKLKLGTLDVLAKTNERYLVIIWKIKFAGKTFEIRFIDSIKFISSSLSSIIDSCESFPVTEEIFQQYFPTVKFSKDVTKKQFLPYDYFTSFEVLDETDFPVKEAFYNKMLDKNISEEDYKFAKNMYERLGCKKLIDYVKFYLFCDCILFLDCFEYFRKLIRKTFKLECWAYVSLPSMALDAALLVTKEEVPLLENSEMISFFTRGRRGGLCVGNTHYFEANNEYAGGYEEEKGRKSYCLDFDAVSLYGFIQAEKKLPYSDFKWIDEETKNFLMENISKMSGNENVGYFLECDVEYCENLHDLHSHFPLLINREKMLCGGEKLLATLFDKKNYIGHYTLFIQAVQKGLKLKKIHRGVSFTQKNWLKPYIDLNLKMRAKANTCELYQKIWKIFCNSLYGKLCECVEKHTNFKLIFNKNEKISKKEDLKNLKIISNPLLKDVCFFSKDLIGIEIAKTSVTFNRPFHQACAILDLAKVHMGYLYYDVLGSLFPNSLELIYTDSDSLVVKIFDVDPYQIIKQNICFFDTSNFTENNIFDIPLQNRKVGGLLNVESGAKIIKSFTYLRPKCYAIEYFNDEFAPKRRAKGVSNLVINKLGYQDYLDSMRNHKTIFKNMYRISSKNHELFLVNYSKKSLVFGCTKRFFNESGSLPYGHYLIKNLPLPFQVD